MRRVLQVLVIGSILAAIVYSWKRENAFLGRLLGEGRAVTGRITKVGECSLGRKRTREIAYEFEADGRLIHSAQTRSCHSSDAKLEGSETTVLYLPDDPLKSRALSLDPRLMKDWEQRRLKR